ncbi:serine/threonine-protein kinase [Geodermatophilus normandii]|uniref:non-specific serine/threonine protein kinase n=1 Tax=Geodermatophilus normandii TaxID=1137989 RepID=A0A6P0GIN4_9ACTN|nr:serine/threonine-protein kinase [Geodermatophilus normandii]NEM07096.1 serine/threonine protein kinase [Geodermatophilus normandii]
MELTPGSVFAGYRVIRQLGSGGMGAVYLVQHPRLPRQDAMKVIHAHLSGDPAFAARFEREAELACSLDHPALVRVHDRGREQGRLWLTMQYVDGPDAEQVLRREGTMAPVRVLRILEAVAGGLDHAHAMGLVHRDVKPANILLSPGGTGGERALLGDFGIAQASGATRLTDTGSLPASLPYAAPEQLLGGPITAAVDVYALGCTAYELLTGRRLFDQDSSLALMGAVLAGPRHEAWDVLPAGRPALRAALQRAVATNPDDRPPSCTALAEAVRSAIAPVPTTVVPAGAPAGPHPPPPAPWPLPPVPTAPSSWPPQQAAALPPPPWNPPGQADGGGSHGSGNGRRRRWPWLLGALLLLAAVATAGLLFVSPWGIDSPRGVRVDVQSGGVEVRWEPVAGVDAYEVHRDGVLVGRAEGTTYLDGEVGSGTRVTYSVAAVAEDGERSDPTTSETVVSALHPAADLAAEVGMTGVTLTWAAVDNAEHYEIRRGDEVLETRTAGTSFLDEGPPPGTHDYSVVAVDADGGARSSSVSVVLDVSPWLGAAELAEAFRDLLPDAPGAGGWGDATCGTAEPLSTSPAVAVVSCALPSGIYVDFLQYPDQAALDRRIAQLDALTDPAAPRTTDRGGWYRQSPAGNQVAWEAWGLTEPGRELMEIYIEWDGHTVADLDAAWYYAAPW